MCTVYDLLTLPAKVFPCQNVHMHLRWSIDGPEFMSIFGNIKNTKHLQASVPNVVSDCYSVG